MNTLRFNTLKALIKVVEHHGGNIASNDLLMNLEIKKTHPKQDVKTVHASKLAAFAASSRNKALGIIFLKRSNKSRYGVLITNLENQYSIGADQYPVNLLSALSTSNIYVQLNTTLSNCAHRRQANEEERHNEDMLFVQSADPVTGTNGITHAVIIYSGCKGSEHYRNQCPV